MNEYKTVNGTSYNNNTSDEIITILENAKLNRTRLIVDYGDILTGKSWQEEFDICGYIGRSTGTIKIPLLVYNKASYGGGSLLTNCIVKIVTSKGKKVLYQHKNYHI